MSNWLFVFSIVLVFLIVVGVSFESLSSYVKWDLPLSKINQKDILFLDRHDGTFDVTHFPTITNLRHIDDNSVEVTFKKNNYTFFITNDFEFTTIIEKDDKFIAMCKATPETGIFYAAILHLIEINTTHVIFDHYEVDLPKEVECKYPEIIEHSFDIKWEDLGRGIKIKNNG